MLTKEQATESVKNELRRRCQIPGDSYVIVEKFTIEKHFGWVFFYNSKRYLETGNISDAIAGNGPVFVNRLNGRVEFCGSHKPIEVFVAEYERKWSGQNEL